MWADRRGRSRGTPKRRLRSLHQLLDEKEPDDPDVRRIWTIAIVAKEFGVLPSVVARDLDNDAEQLSLLCIEALRYSEAKRAFDSAEDEESLKSWKGSAVMAAVDRNAFDLRKEAIEARKRAAEGNQ